ncbi:MAG: acyltransferase [Paludibacteraceae bacterium]|nr:acyltransferase [Paludibacteraceae bacterium]
MSEMVKVCAVGGGKAPDSQRIAGLDLFRVSLAGLIFMFHSHIHFGCHYWLLDDFVSMGAIAMTGFFLLSGYSLRYVYGNKNLLSIKEIKKFYYKRILGIMPLYYVVALLYILFLGNETIVENILLMPVEILGLQATFTQSLFGYTHNGGTWFISCLIIGYAIYPFLQEFIKQISARKKIMLLILLIFIDLWSVVIRSKFHTAWTYANPFYRFVEFFVGVIIADLNISVVDNKTINVFRNKLFMIFSSLIIVVAVSLIQHKFDINDFMILNWVVLPGFSIMLFSLGKISIPLLQNSKTIRYLSDMSYAFFLSQFFVWPFSRFFVEYIGYDSNIIRVVVSLVLCTFLSIILYELVQVRLVGWIKNYCKI